MAEDDWIEDFRDDPARREKSSTSSSVFGLTEPSKNRREVEDMRGTGQPRGIELRRRAFPRQTTPIVASGAFLREHRRFWFPALSFAN
jgi:hypothetical protein